ncbi:hypothetical protein ACVWYH_005737 [Bradyrhizobium sp. GM24.11]
MFVLFGSHIRENAGCVGVFFAQPFREIGISPAVLFLAADRERQNLFCSVNSSNDFML